MREWLTVIIVLLIAAVVLDGLRRMRRARRSAIRLSRNVRRPSASTGAEEARDDYTSELPSGGARVVTVRKPDDARQFNRELRENLEKKKKRPRPYRIPEQVTLNLDEHVPTLMESVDGDAHDDAVGVDANLETDAAGGNFSFDDDGRIEPRLSVVDDNDVLDDPVEAPAGQSDAASLTAFDTEPADEAEAVDDYTEADVLATADDDAAAAIAAMDDDFDAYDMDNDNDNDEGEVDYREPDLVLVINVMAPQGQRFNGEALLNVALSQGMRYGTMNIFHRHADSQGAGPILYSMANIVVPGTFDLNTIKSFTTPGVSLFLALPLDGDLDSGAAFEHMLNTARELNRQLGGELKDENRSVMTGQTVEHYRSRVREYERKQLSRAPA